jgi:uncharacterized protein YndB with AHSA1/START domain
MPDKVAKFDAAIDIGAPPERVWAVMSDVERWHEWTPSVRGITRLDRGPLEIGSRAIIRQPKYPPALWKVTTIDPGRSFTWISAAPGLRVIGHHAVEPSAGGSRATVSVDYQGVFGRLLGRLTKDLTQRYLRFEAAGLKARSENSQFRHAGMSA